MLYRLESVRKSFGTKDVLVEATWQHDPGRIVGLVGRNGAGKSTVLKIVQGTVEPDGGKRHLAGGTTFASLDQAVEPEGDEPLRAFVARAQEPLLDLERTMRRLEEEIATHGADGDRTALDALLAEHDDVREHFERSGGYEADSRIDRVLEGVGLARTMWDRPVGDLSGGQKHRAQIARLLLTDASVLLLDEPTNHLDVSGMEFLEGWLVERKTSANLSALVVSHDRRFLNAVADRIVEVANGRLEDYPGDYATYRKLKAERDRVRAKEAEKQRQMIERTEDFIRRNIAGQKTKQAQGRRKMLARIERIEAPREDANDVSIRFEEARVSGGRVLEAKKIVPGYPETGPLTQPVSFLLRRGDRMALWGPNGCGKTTLLKNLARVLPAISGSVAPGVGVLIGYYDQEMADLSPNASALDVVMDLDPSMKEGEARDFLALFDFRGDEVYQKIATLSGGEKGRLSLARIVFGGANLLLLDEPTNHLDLDAREALEDALLEFEGAIVFVSHDRWFVDRIATQILEIAPGGAVEVHDGNYSEMLRRKKEQERRRGEDKEKISLKGEEAGGASRGGGARSGAARTAGAQPGAAATHTPSKKSSSSSSSPDRAAERRRAKNQRILSDLEEVISRLEQEIRTLDVSLADPDVYRDGEKARGVSAARDAARKALEAKLWEWEETSRKLETHEVTA
ncbi:MAG: ABC-F family ATP-binding cassette domain-containing protein [Acidobacteria bacterium]|nr:ABC-F family ATP-binding cassette domain-containing protein [Acidobacteriota bacterium]